MAHDIEILVERWDRTVPNGTPYADLLRLIRYLTDYRYYQYVPTVGPYPDFVNRLAAWIAQVDRPSHQKLLLQFVPHLLFIGQEDFALLYRSALLGPITRWICSTQAVDIEGVSAAQEVDQELQSHTWYCPITDSMNINAFYHANRVEGVQYRPDWRSLARFGDPDKLRTYMDKKKLKRIVLLEDFVGTGNQMTNAVLFAAKSFPDLPILLCPLIIAPKGIERGQELAAQYGTVTFDPVFALAPHHGVFTDQCNVQHRHQWHKILRIVGKLCSRFSLRIFPNGFPPDWGPWGYRDTGTVVVLHSNTPNNTVPFLHVDDGDHWTALFPRSKRI